MIRQNGILCMVRWGMNLRMIWNAMADLNSKVKEMKRVVRYIFKKKREIYDPNGPKKMKLLRSRIRSFERQEAAHILRPCVQDVWDSVRNPKTGAYKLMKLKVRAGLKRYTLYPPTSRLLKKPSKGIYKSS